MNDQNEPKPRIRWGIVGTGTIAETFATDIQHARSARLGGICSRNLETAQAFARAQGAESSYDNLSDMIASDTIDAVYLGTPNTAHKSDAETCLRAGMPVLVEKPLVQTSAEAQFLEDLSKESGTFLMEAMWTRYLPAIQRVKELLDTNAIGPIQSVRCELSFQKPYDANSRFFDPALGGGSLLDLGVYGLSLSRHLFGPLKLVGAEVERAESGVDLAVRAGIRAKDCPIEMRCGFDRDGANLFHVVGQRGALTLTSPFMAAPRLLHTSGAARLLVASAPLSRVRQVLGFASRVPLPGFAKYEPERRGSGLEFQIEAASRAILAGQIQEETMPPSQSAEVLQLIEQILAN